MLSSVNRLDGVGMTVWLSEKESDGVGVAASS